MNKENQILLEKLKKYLSVSVCTERYEHSIRTAQTAKELCLRFGEDAELGEIAGVAHDICKEMKVMAMDVLDYLMTTYDLTPNQLMLLYLRCTDEFYKKLVKMVAIKRIGLHE